MSIEIRKIMDETLFRNVGEDGFVKAPDYAKVEGLEKMLDIMSDVGPHNSYITDYYMKRIHCISEGATRLSGYTKEDIKKYGQEIYDIILPKEDVPILRKQADASMMLINSLSSEEREHCSLFYDFVLIRKDGRRICVTRRLRPFLFTDDGKMWLSLAFLNYSPNNKVSKVTLNLKGHEKRMVYDRDRNVWEDLPPIVLSENERDAAIELYRGSMDKQIANMLFVSKDTVSYYKKQLMIKTNCSTIRGALDYLYYNCII